jgi:putative sporulation protein YtxC
MLTVVYDEGEIDLMNEISQIKSYFKQKNIVIGISESISGNTHFVKIFCSDDDYNKRTFNTFNLYMANVLYKIVIREFRDKELYDIIADTYFFLKDDELKDVVELIMKALKGEGAIIDESNVYCINRRNNIIEKIVQCLKENSEINIKGFITFRMREMKDDLESIIDKVIEKYMVEKEYTEFIKLLKYFVEVQDSKIDEVNIIVQVNGMYKVQDKSGNDILEEFFGELADNKLKSKANMDDMIISGLIANSPEVIKIHCVENCPNKELIETIKGVFNNRVIFCKEPKVEELVKTGGITKITENRE